MNSISKTSRAKAQKNVSAPKSRRLASIDRAALGGVNGAGFFRGWYPTIARGGYYGGSAGGAMGGGWSGGW